ncbi:MAG TPA: hypothetical protein VFG49_11770 [Dyella sp.]|uniref:hypothetical protein n=1 Tax=Dyella sp. TaxID=1869338 RepID=UPI002D769C94|nr:hypothetical protein [Dyella sp.]HET6554206.1 hypothetical protein [Dyella sp.]
MASPVISATVRAPFVPVCQGYTPAPPVRCVSWLSVIGAIACASAALSGFALVALYWFDAIVRMGA